MTGLMFVHGLKNLSPTRLRVDKLTGPLLLQTLLTGTCYVVAI